MFEIKVKGEFDAAHRVAGYPGKCDRLHGHSWTVELSVTGQQLDELGMLVDESVKPLAGDRLVLRSTLPVQLGEHLIMPISMALHELATNAMKYGALSTAAGTITIDWSTEPQDGEAHLILHCREEGGPPVSHPDHLGFGTKLINFNCKAEGGDANFSFDPAGLRVELRLPLR